MTQPMAAGTTQYRDFGPLHIRIDRHEDGVTITVVTPARTTLDRAFTNLDEGRAYLTFLRDAALGGQPVWAIEQRAGVLVSVAAVIDDAEQALIDGINADFDQRDKQAQAEQQQTAETVEQALTGGQSWTRYRQSHRPVRPTRTRTYLQPPTIAQLRLMRQHTHGIVTADDKANWLTLRGIVDRGLGVAHTQDRQIITAVRLNARGYQAIESNQERAA